MPPKENKPPGKRPPKPLPKVRTALQIRPDGSTTPKKTAPLPRIVLGVSSGNQIGPPDKTSTVPRRHAPVVPRGTQIATQNAERETAALRRADSSAASGMSTKKPSVAAVHVDKQISPLQDKDKKEGILEVDVENMEDTPRNPELPPRNGADIATPNPLIDLLIRNRALNEAKRTNPRGEVVSPSLSKLRISSSEYEGDTDFDTGIERKVKFQRVKRNSRFDAVENGTQRNSDPSIAHRAPLLEVEVPHEMIRTASQYHEQMKYPRSMLGKKIDNIFNSREYQDSFSAYQSRTVSPSDRFIEHAMRIRYNSRLIPSIVVVPTTDASLRTASGPLDPPTYQSETPAPRQNASLPSFRQQSKSVHWDPAVIAAGPIVQAPAPVPLPRVVDYETNTEARYEDSSKVSAIDNLLSTFRDIRTLDKKERNFLMAALRNLTDDEEDRPAIRPFEKKNPDHFSAPPRPLGREAEKDLLSGVSKETGVKCLPAKTLKQDCNSPLKSSLNPCVPEFKSIRLKPPQIPKKTVPTSEMARLKSELAANLKRQAELEDELSRIDSDTVVPTVSLPPIVRKRLVVLDDKNNHGREVSRFEDWFAEKQLEEFLKKYPMTGSKYVPNTPKPPPRFPKSIKSFPQGFQEPIAPAAVKTGIRPMGRNIKTFEQKQHAAAVQLKLETLLLKKKEKKAAERKAAEIEMARKRTEELRLEFRRQMERRKEMESVSNEAKALEKPSKDE